MVAAKSDITPSEAERRKRTFNLELFGFRFSVVSDADTERVRDVVDFVNRRLETIRDASKRAQTDQIALLAALNIAEELFAERAQHALLKKKVRERSLKLLGALDALAQESERTP